MLLRNGKEFSRITQKQAIEANGGSYTETPRPFALERQLGQSPFASVRRNILDAAEFENEPADLVQAIMAEFDSVEFRDYIPIFDGKSSELAHFIECVDGMHNELHADGQRRLLGKLIYKFKGEAGGVYTEGRFATWEELKRALRTKYGQRVSFNTA